jgi:hypothetical protein
VVVLEGEQPSAKSAAAAAESKRRFMVFTAFRKPTTRWR